MSSRRTISAHIATIRKLIKQFSDDSPFDDEFIYKLFTDSRNRVLSRELEKHKYRSPWNFQTIVVPLDKAEYVDDFLLPEDVICQVRKSRFKIPRPFSTKYKDVFEVLGYDGVPLSKGNAFEASLLKYSKTRGDKALWEIVDEYLIIHNNLMLKNIKLRAVFEDPRELASFPKADIDGVYRDATYFNPDEDLVPLDGDLNDDVYTLCLSKLGFSYKVTEDKSNTDNSSIPPVI